MAKNKCCVPYCKSGYQTTRRKNNDLGIRNPSMFKFPSMYANGNSVFSSDQCLKQELKKEICSENATSTPSKFVCTKCNRSFTTNQNLKRHKGSQVCSRPPKLIPDFTCSNCNRIFATNHNLKEHMEKQICLRSITASVKVFKCSSCNNTFASNQSLRRHVHDQVCFRPVKPTTPDFTCSNCNYTFSTYFNLKVHTEKQKCLKNTRPTTTRISVFRCSNCNNTFATNQSLQRHIDNEICSKPLQDRTSTPKVFICSNCSCTFATGQSLQRHTDYQICRKDTIPVPSGINPELREKWEKAVRRGDRRLTPTDKICQLHFRKEFIITHDRVVLSNGDVFMSQRKKLQLTKEAIPTIFPNIPPRISNEKTKIRVSSAHRYPLENDDTIVKKRRLETLFGDSLTDASRDTVQEKQLTVNQNSTIKFILDDSHTDETEDNTLQEHNEDATIDGILDDNHTDALGDSVEEVQHAANENPSIENILGDIHTDAAENTIQQRLPMLEPHPITDLSDDCITIEDNVLEGQHTGKHNPITIWIKEEEENCVNEFADTTAIENFDDLFHKCSKIEFPDTRWTYILVANNILITYWSASFDCSKKIIIDQNLKISAFIKDVGIIIDETEVYDLNTVKNVVKKLHEIKECAYNPAKSIRWKCRGFVKQNKEYCSSCSSELEKDRIFKKKTD